MKNSQQQRTYITLEHQSGPGWFSCRRVDSVSVVGWIYAKLAGFLSGK